ncbi:MAG: zinc-binding alcohol dehydrogenase family protein [Marmoricola sp.]
MVAAPRSEPPNRAAWIAAPGARLEVGPAPYSRPGEHQVVVRVRAVAVNPADWIVQVAGRLAYRWLRYPTVLGTDVAGEVVEVGDAVTRFAVGDRVAGTAVGTDKDANRPAEGAFQHYAVLGERMTLRLPDDLPFTQAAVLPLAVSTAATALFCADHLALDRPGPSPAPAGATVLVWGGSTSVGTQAVQLAVAAGYDVISTCSPHNAAYVTALGARRVFDYRSPTVVEDVVAALEGRTLAGAIALGPTAAPACVRIAARCGGRARVAIATPPVTFDGLAPESRTRSTVARTVLRLITSNIALQMRARPRGVGLQYIWGTALKDTDVADAVLGAYLPDALATGRHRALPEARVVGDRLEDLQEALDLQRRGVSAAKLVVALER